jgi:hypothetical protein
MINLKFENVEDPNFLIAVVCVLSLIYPVDIFVAEVTCVNEENATPNDTKA